MKLTSITILLLSATLGWTPSLNALDQPAPISPHSESVETKTAESYDLHRCIEAALENNFDIKRAKESILQQHGIVIQSRARFLPSLTATAYYQKTDKDRIQQFQGQSFGSPRDWAAQVEIEQTIFAGGRNFFQYRSQSAAEDAAVLALQSVINDTLLAVRERYYGVLLARARVTVQEQFMYLLEEELKSEQSKNKAGLVSDFNVLRAEVALANNRPELIRARDNYRLSIEDLKLILGLNIPWDAANADSPGLIVSGALSFEPVTVAFNEALSTARAERPELKQLDKLVEASKHRVRSEYAGHLPQLSVFGNYGSAKSQFTNDIQDENHGWTAGVRAQWNIFDGLNTSGRIREAESARQGTRLTRDQQRLAIEVEVRRSFSSYIEASNLVSASQQVVRQAEESLRLAKSRFDVGAATQLDVLDGQVALTQARTNEITALHDYQIAVARLRRAMGVAESFPSKPQS